MIPPHPSSHSPSAVHHTGVAPHIVKSAFCCATKLLCLNSPTPLMFKEPKMGIYIKKVIETPPARFLFPITMPHAGRHYEAAPSSLPLTPLIRPLPIPRPPRPCSPYTRVLSKLSSSSPFCLPNQVTQSTPKRRTSTSSTIPKYFIFHRV